MKLLLWSAVALMVVMWMFRTKKVSSVSQGKEADKTLNGDERGADRVVEEMLPCSHCGIHVPASEAVISSSGAVFCCREHRLQHGDAH
jgi:uncharacterized protein